MSGFSPDWLALREPADRAARAPEILQRLQAVFSDGDRCHIWDLGAGTGASVRAFASLLPQDQHWTLADHDPANLAAAGEALAAWADGSQREGDILALNQGPRRLTVRSVVTDLARLGEGAPPWAEDAPDLITASALLDLTSARWIETFAEAVAQSRAVLLATLNFDGGLRFEPPHPDDEAVRRAFCNHQRRDKGFGPAAGPEATALLSTALEARGYRVSTAESPWRLGADDRPLIEALVTGIAEAAGETGLLAPPRLEAWRAVRSGKLAAMTVGHRDLIAFPG